MQKLCHAVHVHHDDSHAFEVSEEARDAAILSIHRLRAVMHPTHQHEAYKMNEYAYNRMFLKTTFLFIYVQEGLSTR